MVKTNSQETSLGPQSNESNVQLFVFIIPTLLKKNHVLFAFASARTSVRSRTASLSLSSCWCCCISLHQGNKPSRDNLACLGQVRLFKADFSFLSWRKLVFRQLYSSALYKHSSLRREVLGK